MKKPFSFYLEESLMQEFLQKFLQEESPEVTTNNMRQALYNAVSSGSSFSSDAWEKLERVFLEAKQRNETLAETPEDFLSEILDYYEHL